MLACSCCFFGSSAIIPVLAVIGCWAPWAFIWRPLRLVDRMDRVWGIPRFQISDFIALMLMLVWPMLLAKIGRDSHSPQYVISCFVLFSCCVTWLWLRGLWVLQQFQIRSFIKRILFLAAILPAMITFAAIAGLGILMALVLEVAGLVFVLAFALFSAWWIRFWIAGIFGISADDNQRAVFLTRNGTAD